MNLPSKNTIFYLLKVQPALEPSNVIYVFDIRQSLDIIHIQSKLYWEIPTFLVCDKENFSSAQTVLGMRKWRKLSNPNSSCH